MGFVSFFISHHSYNTPAGTPDETTTNKTVPDGGETYQTTTEEDVDSEMSTQNDSVGLMEVNPNAIMEDEYTDGNDTDYETPAQSETTTYAYRTKEGLTPVQTEITSVEAATEEGIGDEVLHQSKITSNDIPIEELNRIPREGSDNEGTTEIPLDIDTTTWNTAWHTRKARTERPDHETATRKVSGNEYSLRRCN